MGQTIILHSEKTLSLLLQKIINIVLFLCIIIQIVSILDRFNFYLMSWLIPIKIIEGIVIYLQGALSVQKKVMLNAPQRREKHLDPPSFVLNLVELCVDLQNNT